MKIYSAVIQLEQDYSLEEFKQMLKKSLPLLQSELDTVEVSEHKIHDVSEWYKHDETLNKEKEKNI